MSVPAIKSAVQVLGRVIFGTVTFCAVDEEARRAKNEENFIVEREDKMRFAR